MNNIPFGFEFMQWNDFFNMSPSRVKGQWNASTLHYRRLLLEKAFSVFKFTLPNHWHQNWFRFWLYEFGSIAAVYTKKYGWIAQPWSILKLDLEYQPKRILVTNSHLDEKIVGEVGINAVIFHLFDDYYGISDIVSKYAEMLAQVDRNFNVSLLNSNVTFVVEALDKKDASTIKEAYSEATTGKPLVAVKRRMKEGEAEMNPFFPKAKDNFLCLDLLEARRGVMNAFLTEIGIANIAVQKKERLTSTEANENDDETKALAEIMYEHLQKSFKEFRTISGLDASVSWRFTDNVSRETSPQKNVSRETSKRR